MHTYKTLNFDKIFHININMRNGYRCYVEPLGGVGGIQGGGGC